MQITNFEFNVFKHSMSIFEIKGGHAFSRPGVGDVTPNFNIFFLKFYKKQGKNQNMN